jgi:BioD-like phosphotransacetylase family protein
VNTETPRIFVAATNQNDGKTTTALGLFSALSDRLGRIGFIKPVGQRFEHIDGIMIDEDTVLIDTTFSVHTPLEAMSPIAVEPDFTRRYIDKANNEFLTRRLQNSFDRAAWEKDFCIIEGTGHAGVGAVFDLSNAHVAKLLDSKVLLVTRGGIGRPIDEIVLNKALFEREGVELVGVILNKVIPEKFDFVKDFARRGLERLGIDLLGVIPSEPVLTNPTLTQVCRAIHGSFINCEERGRRLVERVIIGAMNSTHVMEFFSPGTLVITPGDREDVILAALSTSSFGENHDKSIAGLVLSGDMTPHERVLDLVKRSNVPTISAPMDSYTVANRIHSMTIKTLPGDHKKIETIKHLVNEHVEVDRLMEKMGV